MNTVSKPVMNIFNKLDKEIEMLNINMKIGLINLFNNLESPYPYYSQHVDG